MAAPGIKLKDAKFYIANEAEDDFVEIDGVRNITNIGAGNDEEADDTRLNSQVIQTVYGLADEGTFSIDFSRNWDDVGQALLDTYRYSRVTRQFVIEFSAGSGLTKKFVHFDVIVINLPFDMTRTNQVMTGTATLKINSQVIKTATDPML